MSFEPVYVDISVPPSTPETAKPTDTSSPASLAPSLAPATPQNARARLDVLSRDASWAARLFSGSPEARREWDELIAKAAGGDDVGDAIAGIEEPSPIFETTTGGQLSRRNLASAVASFREIGLSDASIEQALNGGKVTRAEYAAAKAFQNMRHGDADWCKRFLAGDYASTREQTLLSIILSSEVAE